MPPPQIQTPAAYPQAGIRAPRGLGLGERLALTAAAAIGVLALAAWQVPPLLDWSRYKGTIASYAGTRLGRHVAIGGHVRLNLLPRPILEADSVTLADRGDGISATIGTLRLEVSLARLLAGHVVPRALTLESPAVTLPWPLPRGAAPGMRPTVAQAFTANLDGGTLRVGGMELRAIGATFQTDPDTGAFAAQGSATLAGLPWRFTALVGAPGGDGISPVTLTLDGQAPYGGANPPAEDMRGTGGTFRGRILPDGSLTGLAALRGPDLSRLGPAPALPWQVSGSVSGGATTLRARFDTLDLGSSLGHGSAVLHLASPASLDVHATIGQVALGPWAWRLLADGPALAAHLPTHLDLAATAATQGGATLQAPHIVLALRPEGATIESASATLPGAAHAEASGAVKAGQGGFAGKLHVAAPDLRRTLNWLTGGAAGVLPAGILTQADLRGDLQATAGRIALTNLTGELDGTTATGSLAAGLGARPSLGADLALGRLSLAPWLAHTAPFFPGTLAAPFAAWDAAIRVHADEADLPNLPLRHAVLDLQGGRDGVTIHQLAADLPGGHAEASGAVGPDGTLADLHLDVTAAEAAALPTAWRVPEKLWQGAFHLAVNGAGPPQDVAVQLRADLGDLRAEAEAHVDETAPAATATITLRHPGTPRLLDLIGLPGTAQWLENGSLAVLAHLRLSPGHVQAQDFSVAAAALRLGGGFDADFTGATPRVTGHAEADSLALPALDPRAQAPLPWALLRAWDADVALKAGQILSGLQPVATNGAAHVVLRGGAVMVDDVTATIAGGRLTGEMAADATQDPPALAAEAGLDHVAPPAGAVGGLALSGGTIGLSGTLAGRGYSPQALLATTDGTLHATASLVSLGGIDLPGLAARLTTHAPKLRAGLQAALVSGATGPLSGSLDATVADGTASLLPAGFTGPAGTIQLGGTIEAGAGTLDLRLAVLPAVAAPPRLGVDLAGPWAAPSRTADITSALAWAGQLRAAPHGGTAHDTSHPGKPSAQRSPRTMSARKSAAAATKD